MEFQTTDVDGPKPVRRSAIGSQPQQPVRRKMMVGSANDPAEADADRIGAIIQAAQKSNGPHSCGPGCGHRPEESRVRRSIASSTDQGVLGAAGGMVDDATSGRIAAVSGGERLSRSFRAAVEPAVSRDLGDVRIHTDSPFAPQLGAEAFTIGNRVHLGPGAARPGTARGDQLLAHELGHVVQNSARVQRSGLVQRRNLDARLPLDVFTSLLTMSPKHRQLTNHRPSTGLGQFDAEYLHGNGAGQLVITVKPYFEFCQSVTGGGVVPGGWTDPEQQDFVQKFQQQTVAAWSGKYSFRATKSGFQALNAAVVVRCTPVDDPNKSHFHHRVQKAKAMITGIGREQNSGAARNTGNFAEQDGPVRPHDSQSTCNGIASHDQGRLQDLLEVFNVNPIRFVGNNSSVIAPTSLAALNNFVAAAKRTERPGSVPIPMRATGKRNKREKAQRGNKAQSRADTVQAFIQAQNFANNVCDTALYDDAVAAQKAVYNSKKSKKSKDHEKAILDPMEAQQYKREVILGLKPDFVWTGDPYSILAHEFGHMLGSPDEYFTYGSTNARDAKAAQLLATGRPEDAAKAIKIQAVTPSGNASHASAQEAMSGMATSAGVEIPEYGPSTSSIMSAGADVLPAHYLPLLEALGTITGHTLTKDDWEIV